MDSDFLCLKKLACEDNFVCDGLYYMMVFVSVCLRRSRPLFESLSPWIFKVHLTLSEFRQKNPTKKVNYGPLNIV